MILGKEICLMRMGFSFERFSGIPVFKHISAKNYMSINHIAGNLSNEK